MFKSIYVCVEWGISAGDEAPHTNGDMIFIAICLCTMAHYTPAALNIPHRENKSVTTTSLKVRVHFFFASHIFS